jgi:hypothetical protein
MTGKGSCTAKKDGKCPKKSYECDKFPEIVKFNCGEYSTCKGNKICLKDGTEDCIEQIDGCAKGQIKCGKLKLTTLDCSAIATCIKGLSPCKKDSACKAKDKKTGKCANLY